jgi:arginine repressor
VPSKVEDNEEVAEGKEAGAWVPEIRKLLEDGKKWRTAEIFSTLTEKGVTVTYAALTTWLRRAAMRGELSSSERGVYRLTLKKRDKEDDEKTVAPA